MKDFNPAELQDLASKRDPEDEKRIIKASEFSGFPILFDLTGSTELKRNREFPGWVSDYRKFHELVLDPFLQRKVQWKKFLGDAYLFFFSKDRDKIPDSITSIEPDEILDLCCAVMDKFWDFYECYKERVKGDKKQIDFREITCAIDYGGEIVNWYSLIDDGDRKGLFEPIGKPIDRCFRISGVCGPGQLLVSGSFYELLSKSKRETFQKLSIRPRSLKGFDDVTSIYYRLPPQKQREYILSEAAKELVEEAKPLSVKAKLRLLRLSQPDGKGENHVE